VLIWNFNGFLEISENRGCDASSPVPRDFWAKAYEGIVRANQVITHVPDIKMDRCYNPVVYPVVFLKDSCVCWNNSNRLVLACFLSVWRESIEA